MHRIVGEIHRIYKTGTYKHSLPHQQQKQSKVEGIERPPLTAHIIQLTSPARENVCVWMYVHVGGGVGVRALVYGKGCGDRTEVAYMHLCLD